MLYRDITKESAMMGEAEEAKKLSRRRQLLSFRRDIALALISTKTKVQGVALDIVQAASLDHLGA